MKTKILTVAACFFGAGFQLHSQGYIVPNGVIYGGGSSNVGSIINIIQNPTNGNYTGFFLWAQGSGTFQFDPYLDEGVRAFLVALNDPVSLHAIQSAGYTELLFPNTYLFSEGIPFYVGLYTSEHYAVNGIYDDPLFGWAELVNNNGVIELLDSALEYQGGGIIAGTQTILPIPEPGVLALAALGTLLLGFRGQKVLRKLNF